MAYDARADALAVPETGQVVLLLSLRAAGKPGYGCHAQRHQATCWISAFLRVRPSVVRARAAGWGCVLNTAIVKPDQAKTIPRVGILTATVRDRRGVISAVEPFSGSRASSLLHLVCIEFSDADGDAEESLLWERQRSPVVLEPNALPRSDRALTMMHDEFLALKGATPWSVLSSYGLHPAAVER